MRDAAETLLLSHRAEKMMEKLPLKIHKSDSLNQKKTLETSSFLNSAAGEGKTNTARDMKKYIALRLMMC